MEIYEIKNLCNEIVKDIDEVLKEYKSSKNWGIFDMLGGGLITSFVKYKKINKAKSMANNLDEKLSLLKKEIIDIDDLKLEDISRADMFFDIAFDNIFSDMNIQNKIKKSIDELEELRYTIKEIGDNL